MAHLDGVALARLRALIDAVQAERSSVVVPELLELSAALGLPGRVVVEISAVEPLGQPLVVFEPRRSPAPARLELSPRERDVAALIASGLANKQIAARLGISVGTVKRHVHHILDKSGLPSRSAIASAVTYGTASPAK